MFLVTDYGLVTLKPISLHVFRPCSFPWAAIINLHREAPREAQNLFITLAQSVLTATSNPAWAHISIRLHLYSILSSVKGYIVKKMDGRGGRNSGELWSQWTPPSGDHLNVHKNSAWFELPRLDFQLPWLLSTSWSAPAYLLMPADRRGATVD